MIESYTAMDPAEMARLIRMCDPFNDGIYIMESFERGAKNDKLPMAEAVESVLG